MKYELRECAGSFFIIEEGSDFFVKGHAEAYVGGTYSCAETMDGGWTRNVAKEIPGAREFAEKIVAALNAFEAASAATPFAAE